ncbi:hypothetical protein YC2023_054053 [Brassica napus]
MCSASNPEQPPPQKDNHLLSLPEDIVLSCLARVPRNCNLNLTHVSKTLRTFVSSPELNRLRSLLPKSSLYVCFYEINDNATWTHRWLTLEKTTTEYRLVLFPCQHCPFMDRSLAASVGSEIYFLWKHLRYPSDLWILDTRSGKLSLGPSMKAVLRSEAVGVIDGKIYVMGFDRFEDLDEKIQLVESVYTTQEKVKEKGWFVCSGLMWFDTKLNVWRRVVSRYAEEACHFGEQQAVAEYEGKLAVFEFVNHDLVNNTESVKMFLFSFHTVGEKILGTIEWKIVFSLLYSYAPVGGKFIALLELKVYMVGCGRN